MNIKSIAQALLPRAAKATTREPASRPRPLSAQDLTKVAGGLPRGGGWINGAETATTTSAQLPRGGGW